MSLEIHFSPTYSVTLTRAADGKFGFRNRGNIITGIKRGHPADKSGLIRVGDEIIKIYEIEISNETSTKAVSDMIENSGNQVSLVLKIGKP